MFDLPFTQVQVQNTACLIVILAEPTRSLILIGAQDGEYYAHYKAIKTNTVHSRHSILLYVDSQGFTPERKLLTYLLLKHTPPEAAIPHNQALRYHPRNPLATSTALGDKP